MPGETGSITVFRSICRSAVTISFLLRHNNSPANTRTNSGFSTGSCIEPGRYVTDDQKKDGPATRWFRYPMGNGRHICTIAKESPGRSKIKRGVRVKKRHGVILFGILALCYAPAQGMAAGIGKGDCTQSGTQKQEQKQDRSCQTDSVMEDTGIRLFTKNGQGSGDCDGDRDRDRTRDQLQDGSCQTDAGMYETTFRLLSANGKGGDNGDRDQTRDNLRDDSCATV